MALKLTPQQRDELLFATAHGVAMLLAKVQIEAMPDLRPLAGKFKSRREEAQEDLLSQIPVWNQGFNTILQAVVQGNGDDPLPSDGNIPAWGRFLDARSAMIDELTAEGQSDVEIAKTLSMDGPDQVARIRNRIRRGQ